MTTQVAVVEAITAQQIHAALPKGVSLNITDDLVSHINGLLTDEKLAQNFRDNLMSYTTVLKEGKFKAESYVAAVEYVCRKLMGESNESAYAKVFPDRYNKLILAKKSSKDISAYVSAYHKSKLVGLVMAQTMTPVWVHNQWAVQEAINTQVMIMRDEKAGHMAKVQAANSILTHLKQPETAKVELDIAVQESSVLEDLKATMQDFAAHQRKLIEKGDAKVIDIASSDIVKRKDSSE